jgi:hypothetical protein
MNASIDRPSIDPVTAVTGSLERFGIAALRLASPIATIDSEGVAPPPIRSGFTVEGQRYGLTLQPGDGTFRVAMSADCGVLPYSAENPHARARVLAALPAITGFSLIRVGLTAQQRLRVVADWTAEGAMTPHAVIYEILRFLTEARPTTGLVRRLLYS